MKLLQQSLVDVSIIYITSTRARPKKIGNFAILLTKPMHRNPKSPCNKDLHTLISVDWGNVAYKNIMDRASSMSRNASTNVG